jgi:hypothetical protein
MPLLSLSSVSSSFHFHLITVIVDKPHRIMMADS